jgi:hypothetical protein
METSINSNRSQVTFDEDVYQQWVAHGGTAAQTDYALIVKPPQTTAAETTVSLNLYTGGEVEFDQRIDTTRYNVSGPNLGFVTLKNTLHLPKTEENSQLVRSDANHHLLLTDYEYNAFDPSQQAEAARLAGAMGPEAKAVHREFGQAGLFRYALWHNIRNIANNIQL